MYRLAGILLLCAAGCGGSAASVPTYAVTGTLKIGGEPLLDTSGQLVPSDPKSKAKIGVGRTSPDGSFAIFTNGQRGANPGKFKIVLLSVTQMQEEQDKASMSYEDQQKARYAAAAAITGGNTKTKGAPAKGEAKFPKAWGSASTSPMEIEVTNAALPPLEIDVK